jgi:hypothetical protein
MDDMGFKMALEQKDSHVHRHPGVGLVSGSSSVAINWCPRCTTKLLVEWGVSLTRCSYIFAHFLRDVVFIILIYSGSLLCSSLSRHVLTMCSFGVAHTI